ncbi:MAG: MerR family transcriptional regulator [Actinomycetales bacterium]|nr:MerR family transcriptional regulator [Actinomycetales bacterium]
MEGGVTIGELARRLGVSTHVLRAWESRYGLLQPARTASAYRLYTADDERRVRAMLVLRDTGVPAGQAAARVLASEQVAARLGLPLDPTATHAPAAGPSGEHIDHIDRLWEAVSRFDQSAGAAALDAARADLTPEAWIGQVLMPFLRSLGQHWADGSRTVAHEHFATQLIRSRLAPLTAGWGMGSGPVAVLACPPDERHDLALFAFGVLLGLRGWRVRFFGADTPLTGLAAACRVIEPDLVVIAATRPRTLTDHQSALQRLCRRHRVALAGPGATELIALQSGAVLMSADVVTAANAAVRLLDPPGEATRTDPQG